jgi:hypothetical protein
MPTKIEITAYEFAELNVKVQEEVLDKYRHVIVELDNEWYHPVIEDFEEELADYGIDPEVSFSGFGSQGDGASFLTTTCDTDLLVRKLYETGHEIPENALLDSKDYTIIIRRNDNHYAHENTMYVNRYPGGEDTLTDAEDEKLEAVVLEWAKTKARELYKNLEKYWDELTSDDEIMEYFSDNEFLFYENGKVLVRTV